jgi:hypothetical protein
MKITIIASLVLLNGLSLCGQSVFDKHFEHKTMRIDYFHTGNASKEQFAVEEIRCDGPWSGSTTQLSDPLDLGLYRFVILDKTGQQTLFQTDSPLFSVNGRPSPKPGSSGELTTKQSASPGPKHR